MIQKSVDDQDFVACMKSEGTNMFIDTWTPTHKDLDKHKKTKVKFPGTDLNDANEIESCNVILVKNNFRGMIILFLAIIHVLSRLGYLTFKVSTEG